jgi:putative transposase
MQGLGVRTARAINRAAGRSGAVWDERYHGHLLGTPREMRAGLVYVLLNFRKHLRARAGVDPCSSGRWFDGWAQAVPPTDAPAPVRPPRTWLAAMGWRKAGGAIDVRESPATLTDPAVAPPIEAPDSPPRALSLG